VEESVEYLQFAVFKGTYRLRIDPKGRLPVPAPMRRLLGGGVDHVVVTPLDQCLAAYPPSEWERLEAQLRALPAFSKSVKAVTRLLASRAVDCALDVQGRILIPPALRAAARLSRQAVVVGVVDRFEIWEPDGWDAFLVESEWALDDVSLEIPWPLPQASAPPSPAPPPGHPQAKPNR
jgi:transcriptional regulator MraZ